MVYRAPTEDYLFLFDKVQDTAGLFGLERFAHAGPDAIAPILTEAGRLAEEVMAPLRRAGDLEPARLENGVVRTTPGFAEAYARIAEGGWIGLTANAEFGGMQLPQTVNMAVSEAMAGANMALHLVPLLTQGQIEALEHHASAAIRDLYLPKLISGQWSGTMNLTEPQAGSDVGALRSRAEPGPDGTFAVTGQKIFISWADSDFIENTCHLVLARLPDAPAGSRGVSLFLVPKFLPDADGRPGARNSVRVVSLEHKMGLHGSPTAVLEFDGATGWLVGEPNGGMAAMFTMMNNARLGVGVQGLGVAEAAYQHALAYAAERRQGRAGGTGSIAEHADIRRLLTAMKADIFAARAIAVACAHAIDMSTGPEADRWSARAAFLTPIAKSFGSDTGIAVADAGIQIWGGMGFIEESGAAQFLRDVRVTAIYEGTNGIQAIDLVGRKLADGGDAAFALIDEFEAQAETARGLLPEIAQPVWSAAETLREATEWMVEQGEIGNRLAGAVSFQRAFARVLGAHFHLKAAVAVGGKGPRAALAQFYVRRLLPEHAALVEQACQGVDGLYDLSIEDLAA